MGKWRLLWPDYGNPLCCTCTASPRPFQLFLEQFSWLLPKGSIYQPQQVQS